MESGLEQPLNDYVLIDIIKGREFGEGGYYIPEELRAETGFATVLKISPDLKLNEDIADRKVMYRVGSGVKLSPGEDETKAIIRYSQLTSTVTDSFEFDIPLNDYVLIDIIKGREFGEGGYYIPEELRAETGFATVLKISPDLKLDTSIASQQAMYRKGSGMVNPSRKHETKLLIPYRQLMATGNFIIS